MKTRNYPELNSPTITMIRPGQLKYYLLDDVAGYQNDRSQALVLPGNWDLHVSRNENLNQNSSEILNGKSEGNSNIEEQKIPIRVAIGRKGDLLLLGGLNKLLAARMFDAGNSSLPRRIPVAITLRHAEWQELRKELFVLALDKHLYQPITHPDFDLPNNAFYGEIRDYCEDRLKKIVDNMTITKGRLLDIGANFGFFSHRFEQIGFECYAVENDLTSLYYLRKLRRAENRKFKIISRDILQPGALGEDTKFDVILALNMFHHFLKRKKTYDGLVSLLNRLQMKEMFFEPPIPTEVVMKNSYKTYTEDEFVEFILQNSGLKNSKWIGTAIDGRPLFKLF